jgi:geranylgeranyl transferase type-1 subunit beta
MSCRAKYNFFFVWFFCDFLVLAVRSAGEFVRCLFWFVSHLFKMQEVNRLTLAYFVLNSLNLLNQLDDDKLVDKKKTIDWIYSLQVVPDANDPNHNEQNFGFRGSPFFGTEFNPQCKSCGTVSEHDQGHLAMNYCALSLLKMLGDDFSRVNRKAILRGTRLLQQADGSFSPVSGGMEKKKEKKER